MVKQWNYYLVGEQLCAVCPASVDKIKILLKPIFLADIEVLHREGKTAEHKELCELFAKYVSSDADISTVKQIPTPHLRNIVATFANADLKARAVSQRRRAKILSTVLKVGRVKFSADFCDECSTKIENP